MNTSNNNTLEQVHCSNIFVKAAAAKLKASGGRSPMLAELVVSSMDAIDKLRDEQRAAQMREAERKNQTLLLSRTRMMVMMERIIRER